MIVALAVCAARRELRALVLSSLISLLNLAMLRGRQPRLGGSIGNPLPHAPVVLAATAGVLLFSSVSSMGGVA
jgi:hypothetical protein